MQMLRHAILLLLAPLLMAGLAAAQSPSTLLEPSDDAEARVERVIKAAEIRLDETPLLELQPKNTAPEAGWYFGGQLVYLAGDAAPEERLVGQLHTFADGPRVESDVRIDAYRLGFRYPIKLGPEAKLPVSIHSLMGVAVVDARYNLQGPEGVLMEQGFFKGAPLTGFEIEWQATRTFSLASEITSTVPLSNMPWIFGGRVLGRYQLTGDGGVRAFAGLGYERVWFEDRSDVVSDINSDSGAMIIIGIEARF
jgi:hypothetical protein